MSNTVTSFIKRMVTSFTADEVHEELSVAHQVLVQQVIPSFELAVKQTKGIDFNDNLYLSLTKQYGVAVRRLKKKSVIEAILEDLVNLRSYLEDASDASVDVFNVDASKGTLTLKQYTILRFESLAEFTTEYAIRWLDATISSEISAYAEEGAPVDLPLKPELEWLEANRTSFLIALSVFSKSDVSFKDVLTGLPDIKYSESTLSLAKKTHTEAQLDPARLNLVPVPFNPFFHVGRVRAEIQHSRYERAQELKKILELRLLYLRQAQDGEGSARLEDQIQATSGQLKSLSFKINKMEKKYA